MHICWKCLKIFGICMRKDLIICLSAWRVRCSNVRLMIVGTFTTLSVLLNCSTQIVKTRPHFLRSKLLLPEKISLVLCMNVLCAREERIRMIGICNLQYADAAQLHTTGCACQGIPSFWRCLCSLSCYVLLWNQDFLFLTVCNFFPVTSPLKQRKAPMAICKGRGIRLRDQMDKSFIVIEFWSTACVLTHSSSSWLAVDSSYHSRFIVFC
jgi:hypothetical protein